MTTKDMLKTFFPIILFSIVLPFIDIITDLRLIIRLFSGVSGCISWYDAEQLNVSFGDVTACRKSDDLSTFCQQYPNPDVCTLGKHNKFATFVLGEFTFISNLL